jgi:hypothetical protein
MIRRLRVELRRGDCPEEFEVARQLRSLRRLKEDSGRVAERIAEEYARAMAAHLKK